MGAEDFRRNFEARNIDAVLADFAPEVAIYHEGHIEPSTSRAFHERMLPAVRDVLGDDFHFHDLVHATVDGADVALLPWAAVIDGIAVDGVDFVKETENGRIAEIRFLLRPMAAAEALHRAMKPRTGPPPASG